MTDQRIIETASSVVSASTKTTMGAGGAGFLAWFANLDLLAVCSLVLGTIGLFISLAGFFVNWYYKYQENQRAKELHTLEMKQKLKQGKNDAA